MRTRKVLLYVPDDLIEFVDMVRGKLSRASAMVRIARLWKEEHEQNCSQLNNYKLSHSVRWYAMESTTRTPHAFQSRYEMIVWISRRPRERQHILISKLPENISYDSLYALPLTHVDLPRLDLGD